MNKAHLQSYLNDHLAGALAGLELIDFLASIHAGAPPARFLATLRKAVDADRAALLDILRAADLEPGAARQAAAWVTEKLARVKFLFAGSGKGGLGELEAWEALSLGIEGKLALWRALAAADLPLAADLERLQQRAAKQRASVEIHRLKAARAAFKSPAEQK